MFHQVFLHFPIAFLTLLFFLDLYALYTKKNIQRDYLLYLSIFFALLSVFLGQKAAELYDLSDPLLLKHQNSAYALTALSALAIFLRKAFPFLQLLSSTLLFILCIFVGDLGFYLAHQKASNFSPAALVFPERFKKKEPLRIYTEEQFSHLEDFEVSLLKELKEEQIFEKHACASCHAKHFDREGKLKLSSSWLAGKLEESPFFQVVILNNSMPKNKEEKLEPAERFILLQHLRKLVDQDSFAK